MIEIDPANPVPLYRQIAEQLRRLIALGALRSGERLPTVRELAGVARVNRNTAARAIQHLESQGVVRTRVGQGTFVEPPRTGADGAARAAALDDLIERLVIEAHTIGLAPEELERRVSRRISQFRERREARAGHSDVEGNEERP